MLEKVLILYIVSVAINKEIKLGIVVNVPEAGIDYLLYGDKSPIISNYLYNQLQQIPRAFNAFGERIYNTIISSYNYINDKLIQAGIMNQITQSGVNILDNPYIELLSFKQLQEANVTMQRWIMSNPNVRRLYLDQNIDGYSSTYKNISGNTIGEDDYNYRRVMDGVLVSNDDDYWKISYYLDELLPGDKELTHYEKTKIINTWNAIDWILNNCDFDFTNKSDEPVKINKE